MPHCVPTSDTLISSKDVLFRLWFRGIPLTTVPYLNCVNILIMIGCVCIDYYVNTCTQNIDRVYSMKNVVRAEIQSHTMNE